MSARPKGICGSADLVDGRHTLAFVSIETVTPKHTPLGLLVLGQGRDLHSERGVECPGDLPAPSDPDLVRRARAAKAALGDKVFVLGHHYQRCLLYTSRCV